MTSTIVATKCRCRLQQTLLLKKQRKNSLTFNSLSSENFINAGQLPNVQKLCYVVDFVFVFYV